MKISRAVRRTVVGVLATGLVAVGTAAPAHAGTVKGCGVPGRPYDATAMAGGSQWMGVQFQPPLDTLLGQECTPVTGYYIAIQDVTFGETGQWRYFAANLPQWLDAWDVEQSGHLYEFAVYAHNRVGWSEPTITAQVWDF